MLYVFDLQHEVQNSVSFSEEEEKGEGGCAYIALFALRTEGWTPERDVRV